jgi:fumarate reductase (CoM/CoB) subunit A
MLGGSQVFGWRAGRRAAEVAKDRPGMRASDSELDRLILGPLQKLGEGKGEARPSDLLPGLQTKMWRELLCEKDAPSLADALAYVVADRERLATTVHIGEPIDYALAMEHRNLLDVAEVIARAATLREESRGSHYRGDFPRRDDANWLTNILVSRDGAGALTLDKRWISADVGWTDQPGDIRILPWG